MFLIDSMYTVYTFSFSIFCGSLMGLLLFRPLCCQQKYDYYNVVGKFRGYNDCG